MAKQKMISHVTWDKTGLAVEAKSRNFTLRVDEPKQMGGNDSGMTPLEALLASFGSCISITTLMLAGMMNITIDDIDVEVFGEFDSDGFTGKNPNVRKGFQNIEALVRVKTEADRETIHELLKQVEQTCPVTDTLHGTNIAVTNGEAL
ncbi:MAG: OsmC family protein [Spirochaetota bacterium]